MQRYIEQLIDDIRNAAKGAPVHPYDDPALEGEDMFMMEMEESEKIAEGPFEQLSDVLGIPLQALPKADQLSVEQMQLLNTELEKLMIAYNYYPDYPENAPAIMLYNALRSIWNSEVFRVRFGSFHIDFCEGDEEACAFPGFCKSCSDDDLLEEDGPASYLNNPANGLTFDGEDAAEDLDDISKEFYYSEAITDDEGYIPDISNYCDRWCERCDFTDKCRLFQMENDLNDLFNKNKENDDYSDNKALLNNPSNEYDDGIGEATDDDDDEVIFEFDQEDDFNEDENDYFSVYNKIERHPITELADAYSAESFKWLNGRFNEEKNEFMAQIAGGFANEIMEAEKVMSWYSLMINTKLRRALSGYFETEEDDFTIEDMNGSAKVALIGIDRSIDAMTTMIRHLKKHRDELKVFRSNLEELRLLAEETFPEAREFIRPGLDEL
jgi:hypothetical protein